MTRIQKTFRLALFAGAATLSLFAGPAWAANDEASETVTITARRPVAEKNTASSVTVITADEIARTQVTSVFDALRAVPGVTAAQSGGPGQLATIRLRGATSGQIITLIDGVPVNDATSTSGYNFAYLDSGVVERIEVLRGAGSAIWGSDAIGGVINVITYEPGKDALTAYVEGGSFGTGRLGARASHAFGPLTLAGYATGYLTDGISAADAKDGNPETDGSDALTLGAHAALAFGNGFTGKIGARTTQGHADFDDGFGFATGIADSNARAHSRESLIDAHLGWRSQSDRFGVNGSVSQSLTKTLSEGSFGDFVTRAERVQTRITGDMALTPEQSVLIGAEHGQLDSETTFAPAADSSTDAVFATYNGKFFGKLLLEGGARYEDDSRFGGVSTGRLGAAYQVWNGGAVRATLGNAFRAPSINESSGGGFKLPNPNLKPEKSNEWEIGFDQQVFDGAATIGIVYFNRDTKDLITGSGSPTYINLPRADSKGVELTARSTIGQVDLKAGYTYNKATDRTSNRQLDHVAKHSASFDATWNATDKFALGARAFWNGEENDFNFGTFAAVTLPSYTTVDLRASYKLADNLELYGRVQNVGDEQYEDIFSYGTQGRAVYVGFRMKD